MSEARDKKDEDEIVQEMEESMRGIPPGFMKKLRKHLDDVLGKVDTRTDDEIVEDLERAMLEPPKSPMREMFEMLDKAPLRESVMLMNPQDFEDIKKWGQEDDAERSSGNPLGQQGLEEQEGGQIRLRDDNEGDRCPHGRRRSSDLPKEGEDDSCGDDGTGDDVQPVRGRGDQG